MAGLLDGINFGNGNVGGLLDFLKNNAWQQSTSPMLPSDVAQYGSAPMNAYAAAPQPQVVPANEPNALDSAPWPQGPVGAPRNAMAYAPQPAPYMPQSTQAAPPPYMPQNSGGGFLDRVNAGLQSLGNGGSIIGALTGNFTDPVTRGNQALNMTQQALVERGVDPRVAQAAAVNPELMKELVKQTFGPKTVQSLGDGYVADSAGNIRRAYTPDRAPTPLGEGYIYKDGKVVRAYEPADKTPTSAQEYEYYKKNLPEGETAMSYQKWIATKDADPNKVNVLGKGGELWQVGPDGKPVIIHKNQDGSDAASIDDKTAGLLAERVLAGDTKALTGLGRGAQGAANILKIQRMAADIAESKGMDADAILRNIAKQAELVSGARTLGTKSTHFGVAEKAMEESLPLAQAASEALPRSDWMTVNKLVQMGQREHSNPVFKRFLIATDTAAKDYARTINPQGALRESDIEYARKILSTADGPEAYAAALDQLRMEAQVMHRAIQRQRQEAYKEGGGAHSAAASSPATPSPGAYVWTPDKGLSNTK
ncbi:hypothetical protein E4K64_25380 [Bradyrhizobium frederickii]|uniref:Uncharacterized protein n=1 Tax=Bradyrhizobium frederickii TaxID=2560054 RepID=A0A4Y9NUZ4_9BRAD|nr:hypothetical protein [Bradyrhizobium frederickii]TFV71664.1 hypothetical protein E4K64_25380 [Bradyrhizobium frederickii]